jgi:hypothetical protein
MHSHANANIAKVLIINVFCTMKVTAVQYSRAHGVHMPDEQPRTRRGQECNKLDIRDNKVDCQASM